MDNTSELEIEEALSGLFENVDLEEKHTITIPTGGSLEMRPLTFEDEKQLVNKGGDPDTYLTDFLNRCVDKDVADLYMVDKLYLISRLRSISFGSEYVAECKCPECSQINNLTISIDQLSVGFDENFEDRVQIHLEKMDKEAIVRIPRIRDEKYFKSPEVLHANLWRFVEEIAGITHGPVIAQAITKMPVQDVHTIIKTMNIDDIGLQTKINLSCVHCNEQTVMELPLNESFFIGK